MSYEGEFSNFQKKYFVEWKLIFTFAMLKYTLGALAHLARAFDWQSRGDQFESGMLHKIKSLEIKKIQSDFQFLFYICLHTSIYYIGHFQDICIHLFGECLENDERIFHHIYPQYEIFSAKFP